MILEYEDQLEQKLHLIVIIIITILQLIFIYLFIYLLFLFFLENRVEMKNENLGK
jgi:hypothetical protein